MVIADQAILVCSVCGNDTGNRMHMAREMMFGSREEFEYLECGNCGCLQLVHPPDDMGRHYPDSYYSLAQPSKLRQFLRQRRAAYEYGRFDPLGMVLSFICGLHGAFRIMRRFRVPCDASILDVGCGAGQLLRELRGLGYRDLTGIDPFMKIAAAPVNGVNLLRKDLCDMNGQFDCISFHHSFEHRSDPLESLKEVHRLLRDGGLAVIRIPVCGSLVWRSYGVNWCNLDAPRHCFLHTDKSMGILAEKSDLEIVEVEQESDPGAFSQSERYSRNVALYEKVSFRLSRAERSRLRELSRRVRRAPDSDLRCYVMKKPDDPA